MRRRLSFAAALLIAAAGRIPVSCSSDANQFSTDGEQFAVDASGDASEVDGTSPKGCCASSTTIERIPVVMEFLVDGTATWSRFRRTTSTAGRSTIPRTLRGSS